MEIDVYVVRCYMEGYEECGNVYHIVGVYTDEKIALNKAREHEEDKSLHLHEVNTNVDKFKIVV